MRYILRDEDSRTRLKTLIDSLADKAWDIEIKPYRSRRSLPQNRRWQVLTKMIADETGESHEKTKNDLKIKFGFYDPVGDGFVVLKSTSTATTAEMANLMQQVEAFAATELGISLGND
jgi:hypothetical protein